MVMTEDTALLQTIARAVRDMADRIEKGAFETSRLEAAIDVMRPDPEMFDLVTNGPQDALLKYVLERPVEWDTYYISLELPREALGL